jgi:hypothetical protein
MRRLTGIDFWARVDIRDPNECWEWKLSCSDNGYGAVTFQGKRYSTHRLAWILSFGDPGELFVLHSCDNPPCCNPNHLFLGTHDDNMADSRAKGRRPNPAQFSQHGDESIFKRRPELFRGQNASGAKLTEDDVRSIRLRHEQGISNSAMAREYGLNQCSISSIVNRRTWVHIP